MPTEVQGKQSTDLLVEIFSVIHGLPVSSSMLSPRGPMSGHDSHTPGQVAGMKRAIPHHTVISPKKFGWRLSLEDDKDRVMQRLPSVHHARLSMYDSLEAIFVGWLAQ